MNGEPGKVPRRLAFPRALSGPAEGFSPVATWAKMVPKQEETKGANWGAGSKLGWHSVEGFPDTLKSSAQQKVEAHSVHWRL